MELPIPVKPRDTEKTTILRRGRDKSLRAADYIVQMLSDAGVTAVFGIPGGSIAPIYDALLGHPEISVVTTRHETSAVFAAAAHAQVSGKLGVVLVTSGPGILNAMNGLGSAYTDSLPVLVIAGEAAREGFGRGAVQEGSAYGLNVVAMAKHVTKLAFELSSSESAPAMTAHAIELALQGRRGPVLMSTPLDILGGAICSSVTARGELGPCTLQGPLVDAAAKALSSDSRKVILAGAGCRTAAKELRLLAERVGCPVMTTPKGKGVFPESHPQALGVFGMGGHPSTNEYLEGGVDVVLAVGTSLNEVATDGWSSLLNAQRTFIHIDVDPAFVGRVYPTDIGLVCPAAIALEALRSKVVRSQPRCSVSVTFSRDPEQMEVLKGKGIAAPAALCEIQRCLPGDTIYATDSGSNLFFALHYLQIDHSDSFVSLLGLGSMGSAVPAALGIQLAKPKRQVCAVVGDGGLSMVAGEIATIAQLKLPVVIAVLNDERYGMVEFGMKAIFGRAPTFPMNPFEPAGVAASCGAHAAVIRRLDQIAPALKDAPTDRPLVLDIRIEPLLGMPTNKRFQQITNSVS